LAVFANFVNEFGTHYVKHAELGASLTFEKVFKRKSGSKSQQEEREKSMKVCFNWNMQKILCYNFEHVEFWRILLEGLNSTWNVRQRMPQDAGEIK